MATELPLFVFTTLGGLAAATYIFGAVFLKRQREGRVYLFQLVCLALLAVSGVALLFHLGRPDRVFNAFANPGAGITLEGYASVFFGVVLFIDVVLGFMKRATPQALRYVGALAALLLLCAMAYAYYQYAGIAAYHNAASVLMTFTGAFAAGAPLVSLFDSSAPERPVYRAVVLALQVAAAIVFAVMAALFCANGYGMAPLIVATVFSVVAALAAAYYLKKATASTHMLVFVLAMVALVAARIAFYSI